MLVPLLLLAHASTLDTIRIEVGAPEVDGRVYQPHRARVRVFQGSTDGAPVNEWTNELTVGDSAGRKVARWTTLGQFDKSTGEPGYQLRQTYDHRTMAPLGWSLTTRAGVRISLSIDGGRVRGTRKQGTNAPVEQVDEPITRLGFVASASDLVPLAVGLRQGAVIVAPVWGPNLRTENRIFSILGQEPMTIEGAAVVAWRVEERRESDGKLMATWFLTDKSPYMVGGESVAPNGQVLKYTEVALP